MTIFLFIFRTADSAVLGRQNWNRPVDLVMGLGQVRAGSDPWSGLPLFPMYKKTYDFIKSKNVDQIFFENMRCEGGNDEESTYLVTKSTF